MAQFIIRIGFHTTRDKNFYEKAKNEVKKEGFQSEIKIQDKLFQLPVGEFYIKGNYTINQIIEKAKSATSVVNKDFGIIVTEIQEIGFYNLLPSFSSKN